MKKLMYFLMAALMMLAAVSCKKDPKEKDHSVKTMDATEIAVNSARLNAWLDFADDNWGGVNYGFFWGTAEDTEGTYVEGKGIFMKSGAYWAEITGLTPDTEYWFKAYMEIDGQPYAGEILHFTTKLPLVTSAPGWLELPDTDSLSISTTPSAKIKPPPSRQKTLRIIIGGGNRASERDYSPKTASREE